MTQPCEKIDVVVTLYRPEEGGRETAPIANGYPPHVRVGENGEYLGVRFISGNELSLGKEVAATAELLYPGVDYSSLVPSTSFQILEGPRVIGRGTVLRRYGSTSNVTSA